MKSTSCKPVTQEEHKEEGDDAAAVLLGCSHAPQTLTLIKLAIVTFSKEDEDNKPIAAILL